MAPLKSRPAVRRMVEKLLEGRHDVRLLSLEGPQSIAGRQVWSVQTSEGPKFVLIDGSEIRIFDGGSEFEEMILAASRLRGAFALERVVAVAGMALTFGLLVYAMVRAVILGVSEASVSSFALFFGAAGLLSSTSWMWLKIRNSELLILLESGRHLKVDRDGLSSDEIKRLTREQAGLDAEGRTPRG